MLRINFKKSERINPIIILALVEFWERFNKYALRAFLVIYLISPVNVHEGLGWSISNSLNVLGIAIFAAYALPILGGVVGDKLIGAFKSTLLGAFLIAAGQFIISRAVYTENTKLVIFIGVSLFACGNGLFKPNIAKLVGEVSDFYKIAKQSSYSTFFAITNLGGILSGLLLGLLVSKLQNNYSIAFVFAAFGMLLGCITLVVFKKRIDVGVNQNKSKMVNVVPKMLADTRKEKSSLIYILLIGCFTIFFWSGYQQMSGSLNIVLNKLTSRTIGNFEVPVAWFQSITPLCNVLLITLFRRTLIGVNIDISSLPKRLLTSTVISCCIFITVTLSLEHAARHHSQINSLIIACCYIGFSVAEVILSTPCLASISTLMPSSKTSIVLGGWFMFYGIASYFSGLTGMLINPKHDLNLTNHALTIALSTTYQLLAVIMIVGGVIIWATKDKLIMLIEQK